jgi:hypothetical protein
VSAHARRRPLGLGRKTSGGARVSAKEGRAPGWASQRLRPRGEWWRWPNGRGRGSGLAGVEGEAGRGWAEFQLILEFDRTLKNCTRRFMRNFDMGIFPKIF